MINYHYKLTLSTVDRCLRNVVFYLEWLIEAKGRTDLWGIQHFLIRQLSTYQSLFSAIGHGRGK
jgi:hypothetical protein